MTGFRLRFDGRQIPRWAGRFSDGVEDDEVALEISTRIRQQGYLSKRDFLRLCRWKTARSRGLVERNPESFVRAVSAAALSTPEERLRIEVWTLLDGVDWPTASVLLHFGHRDPYPILDVRALWSLGVEKAARYDFELWWAYTRTCRRLTEKYRCSMRTLDRALWQYSKERQPARAVAARPAPRESKTKA